MSEKILLHEMAWPDVKQALNRTDTILIPVGSTEQHGPHLPLGSDTIIPIGVCTRIARKIGALVGPPIYTVISSYHMAWPGTITLRESTFIDLIKDYCRSLVKHGFKRIILVNEHGGNSAPLAIASRQLTEELSPVKFIPIVMVDFLEKDEFKKYYGLKGGSHSNEYETATILALRPELVRMENAVAEWPEKFIKFLEEGMDHMQYIKMQHAMIKSLKELTKSGVFGDPTKAHENTDVTSGQQLERICDRIVTLLNKFEEKE